MISVCLATYNGAEYIKEQLISILVQITQFDEIVISDDCSVDATLDIIKSLNDPRIKINENYKNLGYAANFENALSKSIGDIIFLADQDDIWINNKLAIMVEYLKNYDFIVSDAIVVNKFLHVLYKSHFTRSNTKSGFLNNLIKPRYIGACMAFKRTVLEKALPFPKNRTLCAHDYWLALVAELFFKPKKIDLPLILYRRHDQNTSNGGFHSKNSIYHKICVRVYIVLMLIKRSFKF